MKLDNKIKDKIDSFFSKISANELHELSVKKYGFIEENKDTYEHIKIMLHQPSSYQNYDNNRKHSSITLAS